MQGMFHSVLSPDPEFGCNDAALPSINTKSIDSFKYAEHHRGECKSFNAEVSPMLGAPALEIYDSDDDFDDDRDDAHAHFDMPSVTAKVGCALQGVLFVGSYRDACSASALAEFQISAFLCVADDVSPALPPHVTAEQLSRGEVAFKHVPMSDNPSTKLKDHFDDIFAFIDEQEAAGRPVLIYCQQGKSRSASFAIAYLMRRERVGFEAALAKLRTTYKKAEPNVFFIAQLADDRTLTPQ